MLRAARPPAQQGAGGAHPAAPTLTARGTLDVGSDSHDDAGARIPELVPAPAHSASPASPRRASMELTSDRQLNRLIAQARHQLRKGNWLHYRDARLHMADLQRRRGHLVEALTLYLDVWYLDLNGPRDSLGPNEGAFLGTEDPPFDPGRAAARSPARRPVRKLMHALELQPRHVQTLFFDAAGPTFHTLDLPLAPSDAWQRIGPELLF